MADIRNENETAATAQMPVARHLQTAIVNWATNQRIVVGLAADFADSGEWMATHMRSAAHWIAREADIEVATAREWIRVGRKLRELPVIAQLFDNNALSYSKVRTLSRVATAHNEQELASIGASVPAGHLSQALAAWVHRTSTDDELENHQHQARSVTWRHEPDGMVTFTMRLEPLVAGTLISHLSAEIMRAQRIEVINGAEVVWPTIAQQHADTIKRLLRDGAGSLTTELLIHVRADGVLLDDGTSVPFSVVERIAPESFVRALIHDTEGRPINASGKRRHPTERQKRVVKARDRRCVDCGATLLLEFDHFPDFATSGHTVVEELELRCVECHRRRHQAA